MQRYLSIISSNKFFRYNLIFFTGSVAVGVLNYLYYPIVGRLLTPGSFGEVQTLISLFLQLTILLNVLSLVVVNLVANDKSGAAQRVVTELQLAALWLAGLALVLTIIFSPQLKALLQFTSGWPFILLSLAVVAATPFTFQTAYLRGRQRFGATSLANILVAAGKIVFSVGLVMLGFGVSGAIGGLITAQIVALGYAFWQAQNGQVSTTVSTLRKRWWPDLRIVMHELGYVGYALVGSLAVMLLLSLDVVIVKIFFDAHTAGLYAGIATVARIIFFLTASIAQVLLPAVKLDAAPGANRSLLIKSIGLTSLLSLPVLAVATVRPGLLMHILMGAQYAQYASLLPKLSLAIFFVSILNLLVLYSLALRRYAPSVIAMVGTLMTYGVMLVYHNSLIVIVDILLSGAVVTGLIAGWYVARKKSKE